MTKQFDLGPDDYRKSGEKKYEPAFQWPGIESASMLLAIVLVGGGGAWVWNIRETNPDLFWMITGGTLIAVGLATVLLRRL